jgi:hypothetical protein
METAQYMLIVTAPIGLIVRDMPGADSEGAKRLRTERRGKNLMCSRIITIRGVPYAQIINPSNPNASEWVRIAESDGNTKYVEVIELGAPVSNSGGDVAVAINRLAAAVEKLSAGK